MVNAMLQLELSSGMVLGVPIPPEHAAEGQEVEAAISEALSEASAQNIGGSEVMLLQRSPCGRHPAHMHGGRGGLTGSRLLPPHAWPGWRGTSRALLAVSCPYVTCLELLCWMPPFTPLISR